MILIADAACLNSVPVDKEGDIKQLQGYQVLPPLATPGY
jgi:hypothetical protein